MARSRWIGAFAMFGLCAATAMTLLLVRPDCMVVERVTFEGSTHAGPAALRHLSEIRSGATIWSIDLDASARGVERHPWVRSARAFRQWPDGVVVVIEEHVPVAVLHYDQLYYVDKHGLPFLGGQLPDLDFPNLTGISTALELRHPGLPDLVVRDALALMAALEDRELLVHDDISEVAFSETRGFTVHVGQSRVLFGLDDRERQLDRLVKLVDRAAVDLLQPTWVDLGPAEVAIVRPLTPAGGA
jgi:hypothetical protein